MAKYINDPTVIKNDDGIKHYSSVIPENPVEQFINYTYTSRLGDRWDLLAHKYLGNAKYWYVLANANGKINGSMFIEPGTIITIPEV